MNKRHYSLLLVLLTVAALVGSGCGSQGGTTTVKTLTGAGATFPYPLYSKMFDTYDTATGVRVNYNSIGSGGGIKALTDKTVDFGASDAFLNDQELQAMSKQLQGMQANLEKNSVTMAETERRAKEKEFADLSREFQRRQREFREDPHEKGMH